MSRISPEEIRQFILEKYPIGKNGIGVDSVSDDFDLFLEGVIDSLGILELVNSIEARFNIEVDLEALDPEQLTQIGPLSRYMAQQAKPRSRRDSM